MKISDNGKRKQKSTHRCIIMLNNEPPAYNSPCRIHHRTKVTYEYSYFHWPSNLDNCIVLLYSDSNFKQYFYSSNPSFGLFNETSETKCKLLSSSIHYCVLFIYHYPLLCSIIYHCPPVVSIVLHYIILSSSILYCAPLHTIIL